MKSIRRFFKQTIHGVISGSADNDPAGIVTYASSGARFGYGQLWVMVLATPMLIAVQAMCARLGDVTRKGLIRLIKEHFPAWVVYLSVSLLVISNIATLGADLAGVSDALELVTGIPYQWWIVPVALFLWYIVVFKNYKTIEKLLTFLSLFFLVYVISAILAQPDWSQIIVSLLLPKITFSAPFFASTLGLLGTTITPFLFFWQARQGVEDHETPLQLKKDAKKEDLWQAPGFIYSNVISIFIMISAASVLYSTGGYEILRAADAARAITPVAGQFSSLLFSLGIIGAGLLAIPILASSTAYVVSEAFGWKESLSIPLLEAKGFYMIVSVSFIAGSLLAVGPLPPMRALLYSQVLNGMIAPVLLIFILLLSANKKLMGSYTGGRFDRLFGWLTVFVMFVSSIFFFASFVRPTW